VDRKIKGQKNDEELIPGLYERTRQLCYRHFLSVVLLCHPWAHFLWESVDRHHLGLSQGSDDCADLVDIPNEAIIDLLPTGNADPPKLTEIDGCAPHDSNEGPLPVAGSFRPAGVHLNAPRILTACQLHPFSIFCFRALISSCAE
jgi:hypothetical protein